MIADKFSSESLSTGFETTSVTLKESERQTEVYYFCNKRITFGHFSHARHTSKHHKLNLWELQKTLDRGDFIEVTHKTLIMMT